VKLARDKKLFEQVTAEQLRQNLVLLQAKEITMPRVWILEMLNTIKAQQEEIGRLKFELEKQTEAVRDYGEAFEQLVTEKDTPSKNPMSALKQENELLHAWLVRCREALIKAREALGTLHDEANSYLSDEGDWRYGNCGGCCICEETLPAIDDALSYTPIDYHNPVDIEALKLIKESLETISTCPYCWGVGGHSAECKIAKALAAIEQIGGNNIEQRNKE
jgi:hypothetical protein